MAKPRILTVFVSLVLGETEVSTRIKCRATMLPTAAGMRFDLADAAPLLFEEDREPTNADRWAEARMRMFSDAAGPAYFAEAYVTDLTDGVRMRPGDTLHLEPSSPSSDFARR